MQLDVSVGVNLDAKKRAVEHQYEVTMKMNVTGKNKEDNAPLFLLEMEYAGVFHIEGVPDDQIHPFLLIECPRMLFPYPTSHRQSDVTRDGGLPAAEPGEHRLPVQLYRNEVARRAYEEQKGEPAN